MANTINNGPAKSLAYYPVTGTDIDDTGANLKWDPATNQVTLVGRLQINQFSGSGNTGLSVIHYGSVFTPVYISRSQGTPSSPSKVGSGNILGGISFTGRADTNFFTGAYINAVVDGAVSDASMPSKIVFGTHNGSSLAARAELSKLGELKVNTIKNFSGSDLTLSPSGRVVVDVNKLNITGGNPGQVLSINSGGALAWTTPTSTGTVSDSTIRNAINAGTGISFNKATGYVSASNIPNSSLTNSAITIDGTIVPLGSSYTSPRIDSLDFGTFTTPSGFSLDLGVF